MASSGSMRERVVPQRATLEQTAGNPRRIWSDIDTEYAADVDGMTGREVRRSAQKVAEADFTVTTWQEPTLMLMTQEDRFLWHDKYRDRYLGIRSIDTTSKRGKIVFICQEGGVGG